MATIRSFQPVINHSSRILILGSMPGRQSLEEQRYYANPRNHFWKIIYTLLDEPFDPDYDRQLELVLSRGMALWDVLDSCNRKGSLDSDIVNARPNDFGKLFDGYPGIELVALNGRKAFDMYERHVASAGTGPEYIPLPSTSPAHTIKLEEKLRQWKILMDRLDGADFKQGNNEIT